MDGQEPVEVPGFRDPEPRNPALRTSELRNSGTPEPTDLFVLSGLHSFFSACAGLTDAARRAGRYPATADVTNRTIAALAKVKESVGPRPYRNADTNLAAATAVITPTTIPTVASQSVSCRT